MDVLKERFQEVLLRATNWKALLYLDEADLFIAGCNPNDLRRYALVSTFFHHLDDTEAFLLMTASWFEKLDPDIESRLSMTIALPAINFDSQKRIWKTWIRRLGNLTEQEELALHAYLDIWLEKAQEGQYTKMNGRQIRNCVAAASALALQENSTLTEWTFLTRKPCPIAAMFLSYMKSHFSTSYAIA